MKKIRQFVSDKGFRPIPNANSSSIANSTFLSDDLNDSEHRIDLIKQTCEVLLKRFGSIQNNNSKNSEVVAIEKRIKKVPEFVLGSNMVEVGSRFGAGSCLGEILEETGKLEMKLGSELIEYQDKIEKLILHPIQQILTVELPAYHKCKRQLVKLCEQMEGVKAKVQRQSMIEGSGAGGGANSGQDELDEIVGKVDQARDTLTSLHYGLLSRESELSTLTVNFLKYQHCYYSNINKILESLCPEIEILLQNEQFPVFGVELEEHLKSVTATGAGAGGRRVAYVIEFCVCALLESLDEEGLLRVGGGSSRVRKLKSAFDAHLITLPILLQQYDPHSIASCLKSYLRSLPTPIIASSHLPNDQTAATMRDLVNSLPEPNQHNLRYLIEFLSRLEAKSEVNKMSASNIAIVIGPNLIMENQSIDGVGGSMARGASVVDWLLRYKSEIWSGEWKDADFYVTCTRPESSTSPKPVQRRHKSRPAPTVPPPPVFGNRDRDAYIETSAPASAHAPPQDAVLQQQSVSSPLPQPRPHSDYKRPPPPPQIPVQAYLHANAHLQHQQPRLPRTQSSFDTTESEADEESGGDGDAEGIGGGRMHAEPQQQQQGAGTDKTAIKELLADWCRDKAESRVQQQDAPVRASPAHSRTQSRDDLEVNHREATVISSRSFREPPTSGTNSSTSKSNSNSIEGTGASPPQSQEPNYYSLPRPVPAPRSSLLNNSNANAAKPPVVAKKPTIGAKPGGGGGAGGGGPGRPPPPPSVTMSAASGGLQPGAPLAKTESTDL